LLAEIELQAHRYRSPLQTTLIGSVCEPVGTAHIYERRVGRWRTGIYDGAVLLSPATSSVQTHFRLEALAPAFVDVDAVTLRIIGPEATGSLAENQPSPGTTGQPYIMREVMPLSDTYEGFLQRLGKHTRRNIAHAQDRAKRDAIKFCFMTAASSVDGSRLSTLAEANMPYPIKPRRILHMIQFLATQPQPFQAHLSQLVDHPLSVTGGFIEGDLALMTYQINDRIFRNLSLSLMLRSFLVQALIARGVRHLAFVGGCASPLYHHCATVPAAEVLIVHQKLIARAKHRVCRMIADPRSRIRRLAPQLIPCS
jgi:hypothetical protein